MKILIEGWEAGQPVRGELDAPDRAQTQAAELLTVKLSGNQGSVTVKQNPTALQRAAGRRVRVGAAAWDSALVLAAYLDAQQPGSFQGLRAAELGSGVGLVGLVLARMGAQVVLTDKQEALAYARMSAAKNWLLRSAPAARRPPPQQHLTPAQQPQQQQQQQQQQQLGQQQQPSQAPASPPSAEAAEHYARKQPATACQPGSVVVAALEWGAPGYQAAAQALTVVEGPFDLVVAADCIYVDPDGTVPRTDHFVAAAAALCSASTRVLVAFEARSDELRAALLRSAEAVFGRVHRIQSGELPHAFRVTHVELYELRL